jgi:anaphase-promoting complex subunit 1
MTEFLFAELLRSPSTSERTECKEAICLCAGWALGMVLLSRGNLHSGKDRSLISDPDQNTEKQNSIDDLGIEDRLHQLIDGGSRPSSQFSLFSNSPSSIDVNASSSRMLESSEINVNVTCPAACVTVGLMYMRSNNKVITDRLSIPTTVFALDHIRPDLLIFRSMAYCLVSWDEIIASPSEVKLLSKVPLVVKTALSLEHHKATTEETSEILGRRAALQIYLSVIAGFCWGTSLVFAGTMDDRAKCMILSQLKLLQKIREGKPSNTNLIADKGTKMLVSQLLNHLFITNLRFKILHKRLIWFFHLSRYLWVSSWLDLVTFLASVY